MKMYISGPMTGLPEHNFPAFTAAAARLRAEGHAVYNPAEPDQDHVTNGVFDLRKAFAADFQFICLEAEGMVMLPGWENSLGATAEKLIAERLGLHITYLEGAACVLSLGLPG